MPASANAADRNLLYGILAVQMNFISRDALIVAMNAWVLDKHTPLGQILLDGKALAADTHQLLDALVQKHLDLHGGDAEKSLAAVGSTRSIPNELCQIADAEVQATLACVSHEHAADADPFATRAQSVGQATAAGVRFRILRPHARGGLGEVFVAEDAELHREVVLKEIQDRHADNPASRARFLVEAEITGGLEHPGIVPVYSLGQYADGRPFYAMRFIRGDSLKDAIEQFYNGQAVLDRRERSVAFRELLGRFVDVCNAIAYAHSRGVLHRDLKPGNVMLGKYGETLVVDWGLAKSLGQVEKHQEAGERPLQPSSGSMATVAGSAIGTPQFMSPEQAAGRLDQLGPASDVYSLGATLYCLLTGKAPFTDADVATVLKKVQRGDFPPPRLVNHDIPAALEAICLKAMALKPQERYTSPQALADEIERWLADEAVAAYREPLPQRLARGARRHQTLVAGVGATLFASLVAVSLGYSLLAHEHEKTTQAQRDRALAQVDALLVASPSAVPTIIAGLEPYQEWVTPRLRELRAQPDLDDKRRTRASLALLAVDSGEVGFLEQRMLESEADEMLLIRDSLASHRGQLTRDLWAIVDEPKTDPDRRFRAIVALAAFDPDSSRWKEAGERVVERFVSANPLYLGLWTDALRPVRGALIDPLTGIYRDQNQSERRRVAASILAQYAIDRPEKLTDLLLDGDAHQFAEILPRLHAHGDKAVALLQQELAKTAASDWKDAPLDPAWIKPPPELVRKVEMADGILAERFALCQTLPLDDFATLADELRHSGYRPVNFRPYNVGKEVRVAAAWIRDGRAWQTAHGLSAEALMKLDDAMREQELVPWDLTGYLLPTDESAQYAALWIKPDPSVAEVKLYAGVPAGAAFTAAWQPLRDVGLVPRTQGEVTIGGGVRHFAIWWKPAVPFDTSVWNSAYAQPAYETQLGTDNNQHDLRIVAPANPAKARQPRYAAVWHDSATMASHESHGLEVAIHLQKCHEMAGRGYRPAAISVLETEPGKPLIGASVWHRPVVPEAQKVTLARRQAQAAVALVQMNKPEQAWPLLRHRPDPTARSYMVHLLAGLGADPRALLTRSEMEKDPSAQRALLLALGEFDPAAVPAADKDELAKRLMIRYRADPDPGIHSAIDWLLRQRWGRPAELQKIDVVLAGQPEGARRWYVNKEGQTFALFPGPAKYRMGSPASEPTRFATEMLHQQQVTRSFALATRKVSVVQFQRFLKAHPEMKHKYVKGYSPEPDGPMIDVTWFEAAQYCRWLSEQEGVPEEQMCYPSVPEIKAGMKMPADYLSRTGYRLPTEAEWEYASRAGAETSRFYGGGEELLGHYAWYLKNSNDRSWPLGRLKPNDAGLFDSLGNTWDWMQNRFLSYEVGPLGKPTEDIEDSKAVLDVDNRVLRGGSFTYSPPQVRSAYRLVNRPTLRNYRIGLRPARTYR